MARKKLQVPKNKKKAIVKPVEAPPIEVDPVLKQEVEEDTACKDFFDFLKERYYTIVCDELGYDGKEFANEAEFTARYLKILRSDGWFFKIPDLGGKPKPFDAIGIVNGRAIGMEFKVIDSSTYDGAFPSEKLQKIFKEFSTHQVMNTIQVIQNRAKFIIPVYNKRNNMVSILTLRHNGEGGL